MASRSWGRRECAEGGGSGASSSAFQSLRSPIVGRVVASSRIGRERPACQPPPIAL